jgi:hypothetical protein
VQNFETSQEDIQENTKKAKNEINFYSAETKYENDSSADEFIVLRLAEKDANQTEEMNLEDEEKYFNCS